jgi:hypothetical protein
MQQNAILTCLDGAAIFLEDQCKALSFNRQCCVLLNFGIVVVITTDIRRALEFKPDPEP